MRPGGYLRIKSTASNLDAFFIVLSSPEEPSTFLDKACRRRTAFDARGTYVLRMYDKLSPHLFRPPPFFFCRPAAPAQGATQGQRLEKLLAHDFSSPRGRSVAEKNAYILLRKRKFKSAAAVFLLPRPAMLKEALQV